MPIKVQVQLDRTPKWSYRWDRFTDGETWLLVRGEDYVSSDLRVQQAAHMYARRNNMFVTTRIDTEGVMVRFFKQDKEALPAKKGIRKKVIKKKSTETK